MKVMRSLVALFQIIFLTSPVCSQGLDSELMLELELLNNDTGINLTGMNISGITDEAIGSQSLFGTVSETIGDALDSLTESVTDSFEVVWTVVSEIIPFIPGPPTSAPSVAPSVFPTLVPTLTPTVLPSVEPSSTPTFSPSSTPSVFPTLSPTIPPTTEPTVLPSFTPSSSPTKLADNTTDIFSVMSSVNTLETFVGIINDSGLASLLSSVEDLTVFAPTNNAFRNMQDMDAVLADTANLDTLVLNHVVVGAHLYADLEGMYFPLSGGQIIKITVEGNGTKFAESAEIKGWDTQASNGIIHVIDDVLE